MFVFGQKLYHQESTARNAERDLDLECGGNPDLSGDAAFGLAPKIQSAADGGALQILIGLLPFLIDSPT